MDQAKFRVPRLKEASTKMWDKLWRPMLHLCGIIIEGLAEIYLVMPADEAKGSDMEINCLCYALDVAHQELENGPQDAWPSLCHL